MIRGGLCLTVALACLLAIGRAQAGAIAPCTHPFAYQSAVNVYVLEDGEPNAGQDLRDVRKRLAWLVKLDTLFSDSFGSLGVHFLWQPPSGTHCSLDEVIWEASDELPSGGAAVFVDQRAYREGEQILVQSYLHFLRIDGERRVRPEVVEFASGSGSPRFTEFLPAQRIAFPPRELTVRDVAAIEQAFANASLLYPRPSATGGRRLPLSSERPLPFLVTEARPDGWMHIDATTYQGDLRGWLRVDPEVSGRLRSLLPELSLLEGVVGYLSWLQARDDGVLIRGTAPDIARRADKVLARYVEMAIHTEDAGPSPALAEALRAAMALDNSVRAGAVLPALVAAVQGSLPDSRLRNLLGITRLAACCGKAPRLNVALDRATQVVGLASALSDFQAALAINPGNIRALANLEAVYTMLGREAEFPIAAQAPTDAPAPLREAYSRFLVRLPTTRAELENRVAEIRTLRAAMPDDR